MTAAFHFIDTSWKSLVEKPPFPHAPPLTGRLDGSVGQRYTCQDCEATAGSLSIPFCLCICFQSVKRCLSVIERTCTLKSNSCSAISGAYASSRKWGAAVFRHHCLASAICIWLELTPASWDSVQLWYTLRSLSRWSKDVLSRKQQLSRWNENLTGFEPCWRPGKFGQKPANEHSWYDIKTEEHTDVFLKT